MFCERTTNPNQVSRVAYARLAEVSADYISEPINSHPAQWVPHADEIIADDNITMDGCTLRVDW
jgi:hypothetical protein